MQPQYVLGIDLGTTNGVLAYAPLDAEEFSVELLEIPQLIDAETVESRTTLPSFLFLPPSQQPQQFELPWGASRQFAAGEFARRQSADLPQFTVSGAKSWLCHRRVDRHQAILPWASETDSKVSPLTASQRFLEHMLDAWDAAFPDAPARNQVLILTVPASFDASARELTRQAAEAAGFPEDFVLIEEPQAAVYAWVAGQGDQWRQLLSADQSILVCDVGGGTTDLTYVRTVDQGGTLELERAAVGPHLLLGGDNMDLALAHDAAGLFAKKGVQLDAWQSTSLWHACRSAKEVLLADDGPKTYSISVLGRGSKLIGGTVSTDVARKRVTEQILDGFFPTCEAKDRPTNRRGSGFQELGLPFETDTRITRHVAAFLGDVDDGGGRPDFVLLNGGVFKSPAVADRLLSVIGGWFDEQTPERLPGTNDLDHSVSQGAAYYGWSKRHGGVRIRGGTARSYYVGIETAGLAIPGAPRPLRALCVVPKGMEEGTEIDVPSGEIGLVVGEPATFRFFSSRSRPGDTPGDHLERWSDDDLSESDSMETTLELEDDQDDHYVPVQFQSRITELGQFELWCVATRSDQRWKLEFSVREEDADAVP